MDSHVDDGVLRTDKDELNNSVATTEIASDFNLSGTQVDGNRDTLLGVDPNGFLGIFFDSSLELPFPSQIPTNYSQGYSESCQMHPPFGNALVPSVPTREFMSPSSSEARTASKVQNSWPTSARPTERQHLWHQIISKSVVNIFDSPPGPTSTHVFATSSDSPLSVDESFSIEINLANATKERLMALKKNILICDCTNLFDDNMSCDKGFLCRNTTEVFDQGFYLYTQKYQPAYPMAHLPTFNPEMVSGILLFTMCMIGVSLLKTEDAVTFIRMTYPVRILWFVILKLYT